MATKTSKKVLQKKENAKKTDGTVDKQATHVYYEINELAKQLTTVNEALGAMAATIKPLIDGVGNLGKFINEEKVGIIVNKK